MQTHLSFLNELEGMSWPAFNDRAVLGNSLNKLY